ncbi:MAG: hypothetical protein M1832_000627 [Thelocarpon impressellum]|nr:MAG: hypothetical protein M1832_000627 [Thelocarpon impressellum]
MAPSPAGSDVAEHPHRSSAPKAARARCRKKAPPPLRTSTRLREKQQLKSQEAARRQLPPPTDAARDELLSIEPLSRKRGRGLLGLDQAGEIGAPATGREDWPGRKRRKTSAEAQKAVGDTKSAATGPVHHWVCTGTWPRALFELDGRRMEPLTPRMRAESTSRTTTALTPATVRAGKNVAARHPSYETKLVKNHIWMGLAPLRPTDESKALCKTLLTREQSPPWGSLFDDSCFEAACENVRWRNEAKVVQDLARLIVPSPESLTVLGVVDLQHLIETVNESWTRAIPLVPGPQPQPDFAVGLRATAFTAAQRYKLTPYVESRRSSSRLIAIDDMYFPFLTTEVKCGSGNLDAADRQNAHSASFGASAVVELYRAVSRQDEIQQQMLAFSISHDKEEIRMWGHYAVMDGPKTRYYRHPIKKFNFTSEEGKDRWTAYQFTRNVYETFLPTHLERVGSAIDQLPDPAVFLVPSLSHLSDAGPLEPDEAPSHPSDAGPAETDDVPQRSQGGPLSLPGPQAMGPPARKRKRA